MRKANRLIHVVIKEKNIDEKLNNSSSDKYSLITSIILVALVQALTFTVSLIKTMPKTSVFDSSFTINIAIGFILNLGVAFISVNIILIVVFIGIYALNIHDKKQWGEKLIARWYITILENIFFSMIIFVLVSFILLFNSYKYKSIYIMLGYFIIASLVLTLIIRYLKKKSIIFYREVFIFHFIAVFASVGIGYALNSQQYIPNVVLPKEAYYYSENKAIIEIKGQHDVYNATVRNLLTTKPIPVRSYKTQSKTFLVIDLTSPYMTEGRYSLNLRIDKSNFEREFAYIYDGNESDKGGYIDRFINQLKEVDLKDNKSKQEYDKLLIELKDTFIKRDRSGAIQNGQSICNLAKGDAGEIISRMEFDPVIGFFRTEVLQSH